MVNGKLVYMTTRRIHNSLFVRRVVPAFKRFVVSTEFCARISILLHLFGLELSIVGKKRRARDPLVLKTGLDLRSQV